MMLHAIYGQIRKCLLFFSEFLIILNFADILDPTCSWDRAIYASFISF